MYKFEMIDNLVEDIKIKNYRKKEYNKDSNVPLPSFKRIGYKFNLDIEYKNFTNINFEKKYKEVSLIEDKLLKRQGVN